VAILLGAECSAGLEQFGAIAGGHPPEKEPFAELGDDRNVRKKWVVPASVSGEIRGSRTNYAGCPACSEQGDEEVTMSASQKRARPDGNDTADPPAVSGVLERLRAAAAAHDNEIDGAVQPPGLGQHDDERAAGHGG
jgi:hypothetical protein